MVLAHLRQAHFSEDKHRAFSRGFPGENWKRLHRLFVQYYIGIKGGKIQWQSGERSQRNQISAKCCWYEFHRNQKQDIYSRTCYLSQEALQDSQKSCLRLEDCLLVLQDRQQEQEWNKNICTQKMNLVSNYIKILIFLSFGLTFHFVCIMVKNKILVS